MANSGSPTVVLSAFAVVGLLLLAFAPSIPTFEMPSEEDIYQEVVNDAIEQYRIADSSGEAMDRCVQAGFVVAAHLQARDQDGYERWKAIERIDCRAAGLPQ